METFKRSHMFEDISKDNFFRYPSAAFKRAWELIDAENEEVESEEMSIEEIQTKKTEIKEVKVEKDGAEKS